MREKERKRVFRIHAPDSPVCAHHFAPSCFLVHPCLEGRSPPHPLSSYSCRRLAVEEEGDFSSLDCGFSRYALVSTFSFAESLHPSLTRLPPLSLLIQLPQPPLLPFIASHTPAARHHEPSSSSPLLSHSLVRDSSEGKYFLGRRR